LRSKILLVPDSFGNHVDPVTLKIESVEKPLVYGTNFFPLHLFEAKIRYQNLIRENKPAKKTKVEEKNSKPKKKVAITEYTDEHGAMKALAVWSQMAICMAMNTVDTERISEILDLAPDIAKTRQDIINHWEKVVAKQLINQDDLDELRRIYFICPPKSRLMERIFILIINTATKKIYTVPVYEIGRLFAKIPVIKNFYSSSEFREMMKIWRRRILVKINQTRNIHELRKLRVGIPFCDSMLMSFIDLKITSVR
jgi:hypothetical protein